MVNRFRIAFSNDFTKEDGSPAYPMFDLSPLERQDIEYDYLTCTGVIDGIELADYDALILLGHTFSVDSVPSNRRLSIVARFGVGYDTVDVTACTENGISLVITPAGVRRPVAVAVMSFMLALTGKLLIKDRITREGPDGWRKRADYMGTGLTGKTLGILGFGNIGAEIVRLARAFDMKFISHDPFAEDATLAKHGVEAVALEALFQRSDVLSINCLLNESTHHIVNAETLALMKPDAYLINTSRGPTVDEAALVHALRQGQLAGAGLDVFSDEPTASNNPLFEFDNVIVTPHALCWTDECFAGNGLADVEAVLAVMRGEQPDGIVNQDITHNPDWLEKLSRYRSAFGRS